MSVADELDRKLHRLRELVEHRVASCTADVLPEVQPVGALEIGSPDRGHAAPIKQQTKSLAATDAAQAEARSVDLRAAAPQETVDAAMAPQVVPTKALSSAPLIEQPLTSDHRKSDHPNLASKARDVSDIAISAPVAGGQAHQTKGLPLHEPELLKPDPTSQAQVGPNKPIEFQTLEPRTFVHRMVARVRSWFGRSVRTRGG